MDMKGALLLTAVVLTCSAFLVPATAPAAPIGSIAGTVTGSDAPGGLEGVEVCVSRFIEVEEEGEREVKCATTGSGGAYLVDELEEGEYDVEFRAGALPYFGEFREEPVTVGTGAVTGIDTELEAAATIAGTATAGGEPVAEDQVCAWRLPEREKGRCDETDADGNYRIKFASPGSFGVEFQAIDGLATQYFDRKRHWIEATPVAANLGAVRSGVDAALEAGGALKGTVFNNSGVPLPEILVCAIEVPSGEPEICDETGIFGQYSLQPLATGTYKVAYSPQLGLEFFGEELFLGEHDGFNTRFYSEQTTLSAAMQVGLAAPGTVAGLDAHLLYTNPPVLPPPAATPSVRLVSPVTQPKRPRCRKGFKLKKVKGKKRCVRVRKHG
jgi:hypothetical protein